MAKPTTCIGIILFISIFSLTSCLTSKKIDEYVGGQFNNQLPKPDKKADSSISVISSIPSDPKIISVTEKTTKNNLPLIVYWQYDYRHTTTLNPAIGVNYFRKTVYQQAARLKQKLNGRQLEIKVEQIPGSFAIVDKGHLVLIIIHWHKLYVEPDSKDMIVTYRLLDKGTEIQTGKITQGNIEKNRDIRFAQSWKSCASEFIAQYSLDVAEMTKSVINKILQEL